jgi:uncharacterized membrane protein YtjA (UPF0391 family)
MEKLVAMILLVAMAATLGGAAIAAQAADTDQIVFYVH